MLTAGLWDTYERMWEGEGAVWTVHPMGVGGQAWVVSCPLLECGRTSMYCGLPTCKVWEGEDGLWAVHIIGVGHSYISIAMLWTTHTVEVGMVEECLGGPLMSSGSPCEIIWSVH